MNIANIWKSLSRRQWWNSSSINFQCRNILSLLCVQFRSPSSYIGVGANVLLLLHLLQNHCLSFGHNSWVAISCIQNPLNSRNYLQHFVITRFRLIKQRGFRFFFTPYSELIWLLNRELPVNLRFQVFGRRFQHLSALQNKSPFPSQGYRHKALTQLSALNGTFQTSETSDFSNHTN